MNLDTEAARFDLQGVLSYINSSSTVIEKKRQIREVEAIGNTE